MKIRLYRVEGIWGYEVAWRNVTYLGWRHTREAARAQAKIAVRAVYREATRRAGVAT